MLRRRRHSVARPLADGIVLRRFEKLCEFLAANRDRFRTSFFSEVRRDLLGPRAEAAAASRPLESPLYRTAGRLLQQAVRRIL